MDILESLASGDYKGIADALPEKKEQADYLKEYGGDRKVRKTQVGYREDKVTKSGELVRRSKIAVQFQKKIVVTASAFLFAEPPEVQVGGDNVENQTALFLERWKKARVNNYLMPFAESVKSETEAAVVFFQVQREGEDPKIKCRVLSQENGNINPFFDEYGDMIGFVWDYENDDEIGFMHVWTAETYAVAKNDGDWEEVSKEQNVFGKIPVVYMKQNEPEWMEVTDLIDSFENSFSKFVDTNGYFASPMYKAKGAVGKMPKKDDSGRMVKMDVIETDKGNVIEADLEVLSWDRSPESLAMEFENTYDLIHYISDTPDLSLKNLQGLGNVAYNTMRLMFMGPILKAKRSEPDYMTALERMASIMLAGMVNITGELSESDLENMEVYFKFNSSLPENIEETIRGLVEANGNRPVMSQRSSVAANPLVQDANTEMENIEQEELDRARREIGEV